MAHDPTDRPTGSNSPSDRGLKLRMAGEARRIHSQHTQLAALLDDVLATFDTGTHQAIRSAFEHFADAIGAHMHVEETVYFPALHGLLPEIDAELMALTDEHRALHRRIEEIREILAARETTRAYSSIERLGQHSARHEATEELLMERVRTESASAGKGTRS